MGRGTTRTVLAVLLVMVAARANFAAAPASNVRTIQNLPGLPRESLRQGISRPLYRSLEVSPVEAWVVARAPIHNGKTANAKIIRSDANGTYDKMLIEMANGYSVSGVETTESRISNDSLTIHLLVYRIADGIMAVCFPHSDDARYIEYKQSGPAWVGLLKNGKWTAISRGHAK